MGAGILGVERRLGLDRRHVGSAALSWRDLGWWALGKARKGLCLGAGSLALSSNNSWLLNVGYLRSFRPLGHASDK